jgi:excisionase family DNA binding protein
MADDDILTVAQVAAQLHVTPQTVRAWIDSGKLRGGRVGKAYMILRRDVYAMLERAAVERRSREESDAPPRREQASGAMGRLTDRRRARPAAIRLSTAPVR